MKQKNYKVAYKLLRVRKNGTLGSLFINRRLCLLPGLWMEAEAHQTPGFMFRPGWHATHKPRAPHLSMNGRQWFLVHLKGITKYVRPEKQGGVWYTALLMKIVKPVKELDES